MQYELDLPFVMVAPANNGASYQPALQPSHSLPDAPPIAATDIQANAPLAAMKSI